MMNDEASILGLTTLRCHDQYTHNHSVNVSLLSMALGTSRLPENRVGRPQLAPISRFGKANIPMEVLNKLSEFTDETGS
jgi:HD-GYP domain-containing protein (c-di-GMP phosphodiesterase class II)